MNEKECKSDILRVTFRHRINKLNIIISDMTESHDRLLNMINKLHDRLLNMINKLHKKSE
jgi:hypothetical protein